MGRSACYPTHYPTIESVPVVDRTGTISGVNNEERLARECFILLLSSTYLAGNASNKDELVCGFLLVSSFISLSTRFLIFFPFVSNSSSTLVVIILVSNNIELFKQIGATWKG